MWFFPAVLLGALGLAGVVAVLYNRLVRLRNTVASSWSDIGVLLKKRYDLVDNLVETVKGYAAHEKTTLADVTAARTRAAGAASPGEKSRAEGAFGQVLGDLFAVAEEYPDLKANGGFLESSAAGPRPRGPGGARATLLQRGCSRLQHAHRVLPGEHRRGLVRFYPSRVLRTAAGFRGGPAPGSPSKTDPEVSGRSCRRCAGGGSSGADREQLSGLAGPSTSRPLALSTARTS